MNEGRGKGKEGRKRATVRRGRRRNMGRKKRICTKRLV